MKILILFMVATSLSGCEWLAKNQNQHTSIMVETAEKICGAGKVSIESRSEIEGEDSSSSFKAECTKEPEDSKENN